MSTAADAGIQLNSVVIILINVIRYMKFDNGHAVCRSLAELFKVELDKLASQLPVFALCVINDNDAASGFQVLDVARDDLCHAAWPDIWIKKIGR